MASLIRLALASSVFVLSASCSATSPSSDNRNEPRPESAALLAGVDDAAPATPSDTTSTKPEPATETSAACLGACRRLRDEPFENVAEEVSKECAFDWRANVDAKCEEWAILRNCVYAAAGKVFEDEYLTEEFAEFDWYKPNPKFRNSQLSAIAKNNVRLLEERGNLCEEAQVSKPGEPVTELMEDLDGDGTKEKIRVTTTRLFIDDVPFVHRLKPYSARSLSVKVIDIDTTDSYKELMVADYYYEENARRRIVYKRKAGAKMSDILDWHDTNIRWDNKGSVTMHSGECGQNRTEVYGIKGEQFSLIRKKVTGKYREEMCSACPFVYVQEPNGWRQRGEILRNLRSADLEATHHLDLGRREGSVRIRISEWKLETTFVDSIELLADRGDGAAIVMSPEACRNNADAFCSADGKHHALATGESLELRFELDDPSNVALRVRGYYLPNGAVER